jgi:hypothetical protein
MKAHTLVVVLFVAASFGAQGMAQQSQPANQESTPATQQLTGHVLSAESHSARHATSLYNSSTGQYSRGRGTSIQSETEIQVGKLVYESAQIHKEVQVGKDYPVVVETDKHGVAKKLDVMIGEKKYTYHLSGTREAN